MIHRRGNLRLAESDIYYEVMGEGPAIVFVHGLGGNHLSWWQQVPFFAQRYTCVSYAQRGFDPSLNLSGAIEISSFADDLAALIEHLKLDEVRLVAQSMGGWTSLEYALRDKSNVKALVMASTTGTVNFTAMDHPEIKRLSAWTEHAERVGRSLAERGILRSTGARLAEENPALYYLYCRFFDQTKTEYRDAVRKKIRAGRILPVEKLSKCRIPMLFITGAEDLLFPPPAAVAVSSVVPSSKLVSVPDAGHSVYFERAEKFNAIVDEFLASVSA